jgi:hypothetical protein
VVAVVKMTVHSQATIMSIPLEVGIMIIKWLPLEDALNMAKALQFTEQVAVQYFACDGRELEDIDSNKMCLFVT